MAAGNAMRRVVTGHDGEGRSTVLFDGPLAFGSDRPGGNSAVAWIDRQLPASNQGTADAATRDVPTELADGAVFRIVRYGPNVSARHHRTNSVDYAIVMSGSITMELDTGPVALSAGDVLVQRGTIHNWLNTGTEDCVIAFALIGAHPFEVGGRSLDPVG